MVYSVSVVLYVIASFLWAIAALLVLADEPDLIGLNPLEWFIVGTPFYALAHWLPTPAVASRG